MFGRKARGIRITKLMARDGTDCQICRDPLDRRIDDEEDPRYVTFDHIIPRSRGGLDLVENLRLAHRACNLKRGNDPIHPNDEAA